MQALKHNRCRFCSLNCPVAFITHLDEALALEYDIDAGMHGKLCSKGNYLLEVLNHPRRLTEPMIAGIRSTLDTAFSETARVLTGRTGLIISGNSSDEDMQDAQAFVKNCLPDGMFAMYTPTGDEHVNRAIAQVEAFSETPSFDEVAAATCIITVGDPFEIGPVIAGPVLASKYRFGKDMVFGAFAEEPNRTSKFANRQIYGPERRMLADFLQAVISQRGDTPPAWSRWMQSTDTVPGDILTLAISFVTVPNSVMVLETQDPVVGTLAALAVEAAGTDKKLIVISSLATGYVDGSAGFASDTIDDIASAISQSELNALIVLGEDIASHPKYGSMLAQANTLIAGAPFRTKTIEQADIAFPTAVWLETPGTYSGMPLIPVVNPPGYAAGYGAILRSIALEMGKQLDMGAIQEKKGTDVAKEEAIRQFLDDLHDQVNTPFISPAIRSTVTCYGDGAITDMMSWLVSQEAVAL